MELLFFHHGLFGLGFLGFGFVIVILQLVAIIDILKSQFRNDNDKLIWILVVLFLNIVGAIVYFAIGGNQKIRS
ncbi:MAG: PLDc N-terminal domain-containing protein [Prolixibacteraceae bacterium]